MEFKQGIGKILSFIAEGLILFDKKGKIILVNPHATLLLDYTAEELIGKNVDEAFGIYINNKPIDSKEKITYKLFKKHTPFYVPRNKVVYFKGQSGNKFPVFVSAKEITIENINGGILVFRDITIEKELEEYKNHTAKKMAELTPILQKTATGDFTEKIKIPVKEDEFTELLVGLSLMIDDLREMEKTRKRAEAEKIKAIKMAEAGKRKLSEEYSKKLEKEVQKKTEELKQSKIHTETIIENLISGLIEYDSDFTLMRINRTAENILGIKREDVIGKKITPKDISNEKLKSLAEISYPALSEKAHKIKKTASGVLDESVGVNEITIHYPLERELQVITAPIISPGTGTQKGFIKVFRDITRERVISRSKSEFISIAAHQLRTPLSAVKWAMSLILDGSMGNLSNEQLKLIKRGYDTNEKMILLVNDLLNVARIEDGRFGYEFKKSDFIETIEDVISNVSILAKERNITLSFEKPKERLEPFVFDPNKIPLALQNLIDNAIKYTPQGGTIKVTVDKNGKYLDVSVKDSGVGIPGDQIKRLFSKFFRARNVLRMQTAGSGLGLFIVKNIITRHGGNIDVKSKEGEGTTFHFTLPMVEELIPKEDTTSDFI